MWTGVARCLAIVEGERGAFVRCQDISGPDYSRNRSPERRVRPEWEVDDLIEESI
jgi:hypothetical protein